MGNNSSRVAEEPFNGGSTETCYTPTIFPDDAPEVASSTSMNRTARPNLACNPNMPLKSGPNPKVPGTALKLASISLLLVSER